MEDRILALAAGKRGHSRSICPFCSDTRSGANKRERCLSLEPVTDGVKYTCWHCSAQGFAPYDRAPVQRTQSAPRLPNPTPKREHHPMPTITRKPLSEEAKSFLQDERKISIETAERYGCFSAARRFRKAGEAPAVGFPYFDGDEVQAAKYRAVTMKDFVADGAARSMFGSDQWVMGQDILVTEGELDTLAVADCLPADRQVNVGSVPHGGLPKAASSDDNHKLSFMETMAPYFEAAQRVLIAVDMDAAGENLANEIVRRVGRAKCFKVTWREKDANDVKIVYGPEAVLADIDAATPWPMNGLYEAEHYADQIADFAKKGFQPGYSTGYDGLDNFLTIEPGQLTVVTGLPGSGKSELVDQIMVNLAEMQDMAFAICSWENPPPIQIMKLAAKRARCNPFKSNSFDTGKMERAIKWVQGHFVFLEDHSDEPATIDSILDRIRAAVLRYGIRGAVIDPYNYIVKDPGQEERVWIEAMLARVRRFCITNGVHIFFIAHPQKIQPNADGSTRVPRGNDISGSAAWFSKTDNGITVHRDPEEPFVAQIHIWKIRFQWIGKIGMTMLAYDTDTTRFTDADDDPLDVFGDKENDDPLDFDFDTRKRA